MVNLSVLGSTGSIGVSTLDVAARNPQRFSVVGLAAGRNVSVMVQQCLQFRPVWRRWPMPMLQRLCVHNCNSIGCHTEVLSGEAGVLAVAAQEEAHQVMAAIVGASGLLPSGRDSRG